MRTFLADDDGTIPEDATVGRGNPRVGVLANNRLMVDIGGNITVVSGSTVTIDNPVDNAAYVRFPSAQPVTIPTPVPVTGTFWQATQPVSGTVTVDTVTNPVSIAGTVPVSGTFWQATQPISGSVSIIGTVPVSGTFWQATQPVSGTVSIAGTVPVSIAAPVAVTGTFWQATQPVSGTFWQATQPVSIAADQVVNVTKEPVQFEKTSLVQNTWTQIFAGATLGTYIIFCGYQSKSTAAPTINSDNVIIGRKSGSDYYPIAVVEPGKSVQVGETGFTDSDFNNLYALAVDAGGSDGLTGQYQPTT